MSAPEDAQNSGDGSYWWDESHREWKLIEHEGVGDAVQDLVQHTEHLLGVGDVPPTTTETPTETPTD